MAKSKGKFSKEESLYIKENKGILSTEEMGESLGREPNAIKAYIGEAIEKRDNSTKWEEIKKQFSAREWKFFETEYEKFCGQSEEEFLPSEEAQLIHALTLWVLINRSVIKQKNIDDDIERINEYKKKLEQKIEKEKRKPDDTEIGLLNDYRADIKNSKIDLSNAVQQMTEFSKERSNILKQLKMTRDQRVQQLESGKESFVGLMRLMNKKDFRDKSARRMELMRLAMEKKYKEMGKFVEYPDGSEGQPLLNFETVGEGDENTIHKQDRDSGQDSASGEGKSPSENGDSGELVESG